MSLVRRELLVPVDDLLPSGPSGPAAVAGDLTLPHGDRKGLICVLPGGGVTRRYWDLGQPGFATYAAERGWAVLATDHPGTGESPTDPRAWLHLHHLAAAAARAAQAAQDAAGTAGLTCIGFGHSLGAMTAVLAQARHRPFDALVVDGFTRAGLPAVCTEAELSAAALGPDDSTVRRLAELRFKVPFPLPAASGVDGTSFAGPDPDPQALAELRGCATNLVAAPALLSLLPGNVARWADEIREPVLVGRADGDRLLGSALDPAAEFPASRSLAAAVIRGAGHNSAVARSRHLWWNRVLAWASSAPQQ